MTSVLTLSPYLLPLLLLVAALVAGLAWRVLSRRATREAASCGRAAPRRPAPVAGAPESLPGADEGPEVDEVTPSGWPLTLVAPQEAAEAVTGSLPGPSTPATAPAASPAPAPAAAPASDLRTPGTTAGPAQQAFARDPSDSAGPAWAPAPVAVQAVPATVHVPAAVAEPPAGATAAPPRRAPLPILLVDDSPTVRAALRRCLRAGGHDVLQAGNGQEALSVLHRQRCGLLITDLEMPVMDGVGLLRQLQACGLLDRLPVLAISGHEHASRSLPADLPIDGVFRKPWSDAELLQRVAELMAAPQDTALRA